MKHKIQHLIDKLNRAKAEKQLAFEQLQSIKEKIQKMKLDPNDIEGAISHLQKKKDALEKKLNKRIIEVEDELKNCGG